MKLTSPQRLVLSKYLNALVQPKFESLLYALNPGDGLIPSALSAQCNRSYALLNWVESPCGCGLYKFLNVAGAIAPLPSELMDLSLEDAPMFSAPEGEFPVVIGEIQIFLAHAKEDKGPVLELYKQLRRKGYRPWLDKKDLLPGQNWREEIPKAIKSSELFVACLSETSVVKSGYVQEEFRLALQELVKKPPGQIYLIPLRLDPCELPNMLLAEYGVNLRDYQCLDYFEKDGFSLLERAIAHQFGYMPSSG